MQLSLRAGLMAAACALLAPAAGAQNSDPYSGRNSGPDSDPDGGTQMDAGLLYYQEDQGRIRSVEALVRLAHDFGDAHVLSATGAVDTLSGGSPNGAVAQKHPQTFTTPSGKNPYTVAALSQPLDPNFQDERVAGDLEWSQPLSTGNRLSTGGHLSVEHDFLSAQLSALFSQDVNRKNTTLGAGLNAELDQVKPIGGVPVAGSDYSLLEKGGSRGKHVEGAQLGLTQVLSRAWITQINLSVDQSGGYLNDPYKLVSRVDAEGLTTGYMFESRPGARTRRSLWLGAKGALGRSVLDLSYRYGSDSWGIHSQTAELHWHLPLGPSFYLEPQLRGYRQSAADFYRLFLDNTDAAGAPASADPRLAAFTARTLALKVGLPMSDGGELALRLMGYEQDPLVRSSPRAGLSGLDLNPRLRALVLQLDWHGRF